jgi:quercetin dioxygenase-like cupin family protein
MTTPSTTEAGAPAFTLDRRNVLHLAADQSMAALSVDEDAWAHPDAVAELREGRIVGVFAYESSWTWWERHPVGTEFVLVLSGAVVFHLSDGAGERASELSAGQCLLVPEGVWHRAEIATPTTMLFLTPTPALTEHRAVCTGALAKVRHG